MSDSEVFGDSVYADREASKGAEDLDPIENLTGDDPDEIMETGYSPPEREPYDLRRRPTPDDERRGPSLDESLAAEEPEDPGAWEERQARAGRLVAPDEGVREDTEADSIAEDVGPAGYAASAEEAAVYIVPEDEQRDPDEIPSRWPPS